MSIAASASCDRFRNDDAFAGRQAVRLHHDRRALLAHIVLGGLRLLEALVRGGRNVVGLAEVLGEALGAFKPGRPFVGAERFDAGGFQIVDDARHQRPLRPHHDEIDLVLLGEGDHRLVVAKIERDAFGDLRDAGIAGRADDPRRQRARRNGPGQRMLTAAGTEEKDVHDGFGVT